MGVPTGYDGVTVTTLEWVHGPRQVARGDTCQAPAGCGIAFPSPGKARWLALTPAG
jgi:hypothetical protein